MTNTNRFIVTAILGLCSYLRALSQEWRKPRNQPPPKHPLPPAVEPSASQDQSAAELGKQASNPLSSGWLMQTQQNNNWVGLPLNDGDQVQSDLLFQPLVNFKLTDNWTLFARPIVTFVKFRAIRGCGRT